MKLLLVLVMVFLTGLQATRGQTGHAISPVSQERSDLLYQTVVQNFRTDSGVEWIEPKASDPHSTQRRVAPSGPYVTFYCLVFGQENTSSRHLVANLEKAGYRIEPPSAGKGAASPFGLKYQMVDKQGTHYGLYMHIESVQWLSPEKAVVRGGYYAGGKQGGAGTYIYTFGKDGWKLIATRNAVNS